MTRPAGLDAAYDTAARMIEDGTELCWRNDGGSCWITNHGERLTVHGEHGTVHYDVIGVDLRKALR